LVFPAFVDAHTHLDKTHTWHRAQNLSGTFWEAIDVLFKDKVNWSDADIRLRAGFALRTAWANGTRAIRTHIDSGHEWSETSHATLAALREEWKGRIALQSVPLCPGLAYENANCEKIADMAIRHGASALGGFMQMTPTLPQQLDRLLAMARERRIGLDLHVDENDNPANEVLRHVAEAVLRTKFEFPVVCGHCCTLAVQAPERAKSTIDLVRAAGIRIISLPLCNLHLQDRRVAGSPFPRTPRWRGITLIHDFLDAGVPVACAGDNVRDAFYEFGNYDVAEVFQQSLRIALLDTRLSDAVRLVTSTPADFMGLPTHGRVAPGAEARLVIFGARRFSELLSRPSVSRQVVDGERIHSTPPPDFAELAAVGL
jgi:cytosine deaminase